MNINDLMKKLEEVLGSEKDHFNIIYTPRSYWVIKIEQRLEEKQPITEIPKGLKSFRLRNIFRQKKGRSALFKGEWHLPNHSITTGQPGTKNTDLRLDTTSVSPERSKPANRIDDVALKYDKCYMKHTTTSERNDHCDSQMLNYPENLENLTVREALERMIGKNDNNKCYMKHTTTSERNDHCDSQMLNDPENLEYLTVREALERMIGKNDNNTSAI
jgi:hypothetical protein